MQAQFYRDVFQIALRYGLTSAPNLNDPRFVARLVFDATRPAGTPKARFASIFPGKDGALIQVRLRDGLVRTPAAHGDREHPRRDADAELEPLAG